MKKLLSRKVLAVTSVVLLFSTVSAVAYAGTQLKKIEAYQNAGIQIEVDGSKVNLGSGADATYPIVYKGTSYVPAKAVAEALGGTVQWDGSRQVVAITSGSVDANAGIPYKDNSSSTTVPDTSSPSTKPTTPTPSDVSSGGFTKELAKNIDMKKVGEDSKSQALKAIKAYAKAVATEDYSDIDSFISASIIAKVEFDTFWNGPSYTKESIHEKIAGIRSANKKDTLTQWNKVVQQATVSDVTLDSTSKSENSAFIYYTLKVKGFDAFSTIYLNLIYTIPYKEANFKLDRFSF